MLTLLEMSTVNKQQVKLTRTKGMKPQCISLISLTQLLAATRKYCYMLQVTTV